MTNVISLPKKSEPQTQRSVLIFDTETNGLFSKNGLGNVSIMQLTIIDASTGEMIFNEYIYPFAGDISGFEFHKINAQKLKDENALTLRDALLKLRDVVQGRYGRKAEILLLAYNCFGFDQAILESNFKMVGMRMPLNWHFMDLYPFIKYKFPKQKFPSFHNHQLATIYFNLLNTNQDEAQINFHTSDADTHCLLAIFEAVQVFGDEIWTHVRPRFDSGQFLTTPLKNALGAYSPWMRFEQHGIHNIGDLYSQFLNLGCSKEALKRYIQTELDVWSWRRASSMAEQIEQFHQNLHFPYQRPQTGTGKGRVIREADTNTQTQTQTKTKIKTKKCDEKVGARPKLRMQLRKRK